VIRALPWLLLSLLPPAALADVPADAALHLELGRQALARHDPAAAVRELEQAVALAPDSAPAHTALGDAYGRSAEQAGLWGKFGLARKCVAEYQRAVGLDPGNVEIHERLFTYYSRAPAIVGGGPARAAGEAAAIARLDPVRGHLAYATLDFAAAKYDLAFGELDAVLQGAPRNYVVLFQLGRLAAVSGGHLDRGLAALRLCLGLAAPAGAPSHAVVQWRIGNILEWRGDPAGARAAYTAALQLEPGFTAASDALAHLK
jgi:tetratricopeptide (TPR) repeat protein